MDEADLGRPFLLAPDEPHPSLTLRDYFQTLVQFLVHDDGKHLSSAFRMHHRDLTLQDVREIRIRSEKHGTFYHIASIEIETRNDSFKFASSTAVTGRGKRCLQREIEVISELTSASENGYLPGILAAADVPFGASTVSSMLSEWFEGYHEWHLHRDEKDGDQRLLLWDQERGDRFLTSSEAREVYRKCSVILTTYFDFRDFRQIHPWRHAAGDFVVRAREGEVDVRLTTARDYRPLMNFGVGGKAALTALIYFFLGLSVNMRLDRQNGVGDILWADGTVLPAVVEGFFQALGSRERDRSPAPAPVEDIYALTARFSSEDLRRLLDSLLEPYYGDDAEALEAIQDRLPAHARELHDAVRQYAA